MMDEQSTEAERVKLIERKMRRLWGLSFAQRRRYWVLYNDTPAGACRQLGKAGRRCVNELRKEWPFPWLKKFVGGGA